MASTVNLAPEDVSEKVQSSPGSAVAIFREPNALLKVQTVAPSLGSSAVRIQGLRGRYTQILADGLPLYGSETGELSLVQIPPLDLGLLGRAEDHIALGDPELARVAEVGERVLVLAGVE